MQRAVCVVWQDAAATIIKQGPLALLRITQKSPFSFYPTCSCENNFKYEFQHFSQLRCTTFKVPQRDICLGLCHGTQGGKQFGGRN